MRSWRSDSSHSRQGDGEPEQQRNAIATPRARTGMGWNRVTRSIMMIGKPNLKLRNATSKLR